MTANERLVKELEARLGLPRGDAEEIAEIAGVHRDNAYHLGYGRGYNEGLKEAERRQKQKERA